MTIFSVVVVCWYSSVLKMLAARLITNEKVKISTSNIFSVTFSIFNMDVANLFTSLYSYKHSS